MKKRFLILTAVALAAVMAIVGCSSGVNLDTDLGTFKVIHASTMDTYSTLNAASGETLLVVRMTVVGSFDETRFKSHFAAEDKSSVAKVKFGAGEYNCIAVAYQGLPDKDKVEYVLVFSVPKTSAASVETFSLAAPNKAPVSIKLAK
jgi:basic membrane lipoprotein Med (substrate-binding protein (PBP1-ABC) superfamily)